MKKYKRCKYGFLLLIYLVLMPTSYVMAQEEPETPEEVVKLHYYNHNNSMQYLILESMLKEGNKFTPQPGETYELYLAGDEEKLIAKVRTNESGKAKAFIPPALKAYWNAAVQPGFTVKQGNEDVLTDILITRAKISIDTASEEGARSITVSVLKWENDEWVPAPEVEMWVGFRRLGGILSAGDDETYTTDENGMVIVEVAKENLPGDKKGNLILAASINNNDEFGNLLIEKIVPWGTVVTTNTQFFNQRTLWSHGNKAPYWLLFTAYAIILGVWGTLIYLVIQLFKIRKLGTEPIGAET